MLLANKRATKGDSKLATPVAKTNSKSGAKATKSKRPTPVATETNSKSGAKATKSKRRTPVAKETKSQGNFLERFVELATNLIMNATH